MRGKGAPLKGGSPLEQAREEFQNHTRLPASDKFDLKEMGLFELTTIYPDTWANISWPLVNTTQIFSNQLI